jgi:hypothetical protein
MGKDDKNKDPQKTYYALVIRGKAGGGRYGRLRAWDGRSIVCLQRLHCWNAVVRVFSVSV